MFSRVFLNKVKKRFGSIKRFKIVQLNNDKPLVGIF